MPEPVLRVRDHAGGWRPVRDFQPSRRSLRREGDFLATRYVADRLIVRGMSGDDPLIAVLQAAAERRGLRLAVEPVPTAASRAQSERMPVRDGAALRIEGGSDDVDALDMLDEVVAEAGDDARIRLGLDHVLVGHKFTVSHGTPGGRAPVIRIGQPPRRTRTDGVDAWVTGDGVARPVVAVVDTGIGAHPWFDVPGTVVVRDATLDGAPIGTHPAEEPAGDAEVGGCSESDGASLDPYAGHGTFIAGVIHQVCPDAALLPVRTVSGDGTVAEWDLVNTLERLLEYHLRGVGGIAGHHAVDVVVLAVGFRPESFADDDYEGVLRGVLRDLRRAGVLVIVSAGNDASVDPIVPAAWAPPVDRSDDGAVPLNSADLTEDYVPLLTVTASNPDGTLASFSNDGPWVTTVRPGVALMSAMPTTFDGSLRPPADTDAVRDGFDPDDFRAGFGIWSGTSFAAPVLAGELAGKLLAERAPVTELAGGVTPSVQVGDPLMSARVAAAWRAIRAVDGLFAVTEV